MGLRDAARIVEHERWTATKIGGKDERFKRHPRSGRTPTENLKLATGRFVIHGIHNYVRRFMGLSIDERRLGE
jgi:hypothetical protein